MRMRIKLPFLLLLAAALLTGCGKQQLEFTVIDGETQSVVSMAEGETIEGSALVYTQSGAVFYADGYRLEEPLYGAIKEPPEKTVMDIAREAEHLLDDGERVLIVYIDGLGYGSFERAVADGAVPNLASLRYEKAASVYPTITPVNYAAMITGKAPAENGVTKRGIHEISCETVFDYAARLGIESYASEGDTQILKLTNTTLELSPDLNGSGTGDDEIFACALAALNDYGLVFVHFHSVDDASHEYGPGSDEARKALVRADEWVGELLSAWDGRVLITADHGQHEQDGTGDAAYSDRRGTHGDFAVSDIFVPYFER